MSDFIENPWKNITWNNTLAGCDRDYFNQKYGSPEKYAAIINKRDSQRPPSKKIGLDFSCLPEPFSGDVRSNVYCLNKNPGEPDVKFNGDPCFEELTRLNLAHDWTGLFWTDRIRNQHREIHDGVDWLRHKMSKLQTDLRHAPNLFFIDFFPYHSAHGFSFPTDLPSNHYRNYLVKKAMEENKIIIVMRQKKDWFSAVDGLEKYPRLITLRCSAGGWLSSDNFDYAPGVHYSDLLGAL